MSDFKKQMHLTDDVWAKIIKLRDPMCRFNLPDCTGRSTDACHVFPRDNMATRWNLFNGIGGCRSCHSWQEQHPEEAMPIMRQILGFSTYMSLKAKAASTVKMFPGDIKDTRKTLKKYLKTLL